jgi:hypothetical protein
VSPPVSNHTFLTSTASPIKPAADDKTSDRRGLLMASVSIPVFWYMLFDESCIAHSSEWEPDGPPYPYLTTRTADGLARAEARWPAVSSVLRRQITHLFRTWLSFVRGHAIEYLHCETAELAGMFDTPDGFERDVRTCLAAFNDIPQRTEKGVRLNGRWRTLLEQAHANVSEGQLVALGNWSYCGAAYQFEVPWNDTGEVVCGTMSETVRTAPAIGQRAEDLVAYLETVHSPAFAVRVRVCRCGGDVFRLRYTRDGGAQRECPACGRRAFFGQTSSDYWKEDEAVSWACEGCGGVECNAAAKFEVDWHERKIEYQVVGQRCVGCGRMGACVGGVCVEEKMKDIDDNGHWQQAWDLYVEGVSLSDAKRDRQAVAKLRAAWDDLPEPRENHEWAEDLLGYTAGSLFRLGEWAECRRVGAMIRDRGMNFDFWMSPVLLGAVAFELGEIDSALDLLRRVHKGGFKGYDPKYLRFVRSQLKSSGG